MRTHIVCIARLSSVLLSSCPAPHASIAPKLGSAFGQPHPNKPVLIRPVSPWCLAPRS